VEFDSIVYKFSGGLLLRQNAMEFFGHVNVTVGKWLMSGHKNYEQDTPKVVAVCVVNYKKPLSIVGTNRKATNIGRGRVVGGLLRGMFFLFVRSILNLDCPPVNGKQKDAVPATLWNTRW
jgi:hypothetical protein